MIARCIAGLPTEMLILHCLATILGYAEGCADERVAGPLTASPNSAGPALGDSIRG